MRETLILITGILIVLISGEMIVRYFMEKVRKKNEAKAHEDIYTDGAKVLYSDSDDAYMMTYRRGNILLTGKPDFVLENNKGEVYVKDLKSGNSPGYVKKEFRMQLAAYFLLIKEDLKKEVKYGVIHYQEDMKNVRLDNTPELINELFQKMDLLYEAKKDIDGYIGTAKRNHNEKGICMSCEFKHSCTGCIK